MYSFYCYKVVAEEGNSSKFQCAASPPLLLWTFFSQMYLYHNTSRTYDRNSCFTGASKARIGYLVQSKNRHQLKCRKLKAILLLSSQTMLCVISLSYCVFPLSFQLLPCVDIAVTASLVAGLTLTHSYSQESCTPLTNQKFPLVPPNCLRSGKANVWPTWHCDIDCNIEW